jgi:hypothetical protein
MNCSFERLLLESWTKNEFIRAIILQTSNIDDKAIYSPVLLDNIIDLLKVWKNSFSGLTCENK